MISNSRSGGRRAFFWRSLGPGLLFAGAAVGVSHLVQSTRAGAVYGFGLLLVIVAANVLKYPAFAFGPYYAAATGTSLLEGYRRQGRWALFTYAVLTLGTMFTVQAAVTVVTAGLAKNLLRLDSTVSVISGGLMAICAAILAAGKYHWLDRIMKVVVAALTVLTVLATVLMLPRIDWGGVRLWPASDQWNLATAAFVAPLVGWMPSAIDIAVWHSLWTLAKRDDTGHAPTVKESMLDFNIGYLGTAFLAVCFMLLGAGVLFGSGVRLAGGAGAFAGQVIGLYTDTLGSWSRYLIGGCAFAVMFSTTLTVTDGFPRALTALLARFRAPEQPDHMVKDSGPVYWGSLLALIVGAYIIIDLVLVRRSGPIDFKTLIDVATALAFLTAPILAVLNHRAVFAAGVPRDKRPGERMRKFSLVCIALLTLFALSWLYVQFLA